MVIHTFALNIMYSVPTRKYENWPDQITETGVCKIWNLFHIVGKSILPPVHLNQSVAWNKNSILCFSTKCFCQCLVEVTNERDSVQSLYAKIVSWMSHSFCQQWQSSNIDPQKKGRLLTTWIYRSTALRARKFRCLSMYAYPTVIEADPPVPGIVH